MSGVVIAACEWPGRRLQAYRAAETPVVHLADVGPAINLVAQSMGAVTPGDTKGLLHSDVDALSPALPPHEQPDVCCVLLKHRMAARCENPWHLVSLTLAVPQRLPDHVVLPS